MLRKLSGFALLAALAAAPLTVAQDKDKKEGDKETPIAKDTPETKGAKAMNAALDMVELGREHKLPEALIAAAKLLAAIDPKQAEGEKEKLTYDPKKQALDLLKEAEKMEGASADHKKLIAAARDKIQ